MITERIKKRYGDNLCRYCITALTGADLETKNCVYETYVRPCARCKDARHIVSGLRFSGRRKMSGKRLNALI